MAIADYIVYDQKLRYFHVLGTCSIVVCTIVISLSGVIGGDDTETVKSVEEAAMPTWVPVIFGVITPMFFCTNGILTKHLTSEKVGFVPSTISFSAYLFVNILVMIAAIPYWMNNGFSQYLFWLGLVGSIINTLGIVFI